MKALRPSSDISAEIMAFRLALPEDNAAPPAIDFAAQLQWEAWENHRRQLETEFEAAVKMEERDGRSGLVDTGVSRSSSDVKAQLDAFIGALPTEGAGDLKEDFVAQLQWEAWENHRRQLETEFEAAVKKEDRDEKSGGSPELIKSRSSSGVEAQIDAFIATLPTESGVDLKKDFAARLQWEAWRSHLQELDSELNEARSREARSAGILLVSQENPSKFAFQQTHLSGSLFRLVIHNKIVKSLEESDTLLLGERGAGKSTIAEQLLANPPTGRRIIAINAGRLTSSSSLIFSMARAVRPDANPLSFSSHLWNEAIDNLSTSLEIQLDHIWFVVDDFDIFLKTVVKEGGSAELHRTMDVLQAIRGRFSRIGGRFLLVTSGDHPVIEQSFTSRTTLTDFKRVEIPPLDREEVKQLLTLSHQYNYVASQDEYNCFSELLPALPLYVALFAVAMPHRISHPSSQLSLPEVYREIVTDFSPHSYFSRLFDRLHSTFNSNLRPLAQHLLFRVAKYRSGVNYMTLVQGLSENFLADNERIQVELGSQILERQVSHTLEMLKSEGSLSVTEESGELLIRAAQPIQDIWAKIKAPKS